MTFEGIRPVLHLAFEKTPDEPIRFGDLDRLVDRMLASGVEGLVVLGLARATAVAIRAQGDELLRHHFRRLADATGLPTLDRTFADLEGPESPGFAGVAE